MLLKGRKTPRRMRGEGGDAFERNFPSPVTLAGSMQVLFNAPSSAFVLRRLRLVLHPSQIHQPRYFHCVSTSQVCQKRGRPEHPTPLPCIAINRAAARTSSLERLVCMRISRAAQNWQNTQLSGPPLPRRPRVRPSPVTPVSRPLHDLWPADI